MKFLIGNKIVKNVDITGMPANSTKSTKGIGGNLSKMLINTARWIK